MLNRGSFAQRGTSALGFDLGSELGLARFVLTDMQASPLTDPGCGALRSLWPPLTGAGGKLGIFAQDQRYGLATRTGAYPVRKVQGEVVLGEEPVPLAVKAHALQTIDEKPTVFVKNGKGFEPREVTTGKHDDEFVQIKAGIAAGEKYAADNSFRLKSEMTRPQPGEEE